MIELLIVTGPLGAGKTTFVNRLLKREVAGGRRVGVVINEFGAVSVDGALVEAGLGAERPEVAGIADLVNGCVCCSLRDDVVATLAAWAGQEDGRRPERIVIETTGLADPVDLLDLEREPALEGRVRLAGLVTVVSALAPLDTLRKPLVRNQAGLASLLVLSKGDLDPSMAVAWEGELRGAFGDVAIVQGRQGELPEGAPDPWRGLVKAAPEGWHQDGESFADARALHLAFDHPVDPDALEALFQGPGAGALGLGGELLRAKGVAVFAGWPTRHDGSDRWAFQFADGRLEVGPLPAAPDGALAPVMAVLIGRGLHAPGWKQALRDLERPPEGARRKVVLPR